MAIEATEFYTNKRFIKVQIVNIKLAFEVTAAIANIGKLSFLFSKSK